MKIALMDGGNSIADRFIKWLTNSNYTHCFLILDQNVDGSALILESQLHGGVHFNVADYSGCKVYQINNPTQDITCLFPFIGDNYGLIDGFGFFIARLLKLKKNPITSGFICIKLVLYWLKRSPVAADFANLDESTASFNDMDAVMAKSPNFTLIQNLGS